MLGALTRVPWHFLFIYSTTILCMHRQLLYRSSEVLLLASYVTYLLNSVSTPSPGRSPFFPPPSPLLPKEYGYWLPHLRDALTSLPLQRRCYSTVPTAPESRL